MPFRAKYFGRNGSSLLLPSASSGAPAMPTGSAFMLTGSYTYGGQQYDCTLDGLYRFQDMSNGSVINRFVRKPVVADINLYDFLSGICWNHVHGDGDNHTDYQGIANAARFRRMRSTCGNIVALMVWYFGLIGIQARSRNPHTLGPVFGWDDGHYVMETLIGSVKMWDLTNKRYFVDGSGAHMSMDAVVASINAGVQPDFVDLAPGALKYNSQNLGAIDPSISADMYLSTPDEIRDWDLRVLQAAYPQ